MDLFTKRCGCGAIYKPAVATSRSCAKCESTAVARQRSELQRKRSDEKPHPLDALTPVGGDLCGGWMSPVAMPYNSAPAAWGGARGVTIPAESPLAQSGYQYTVDDLRAAARKPNLVVSDTHIANVTLPTTAWANATSGSIMDDLRTLVEQCVQEVPTLYPGETRARWRQRCIDMDIGDAIDFCRVAETISERMKLTFMRRAERGEGLLDSGRAFVQGQARYLFDEDFTRRTTVEAKFGADARGYRIVVVELAHTLFHSGHELKATYTLT